MNNKTDFVRQSYSDIAQGKEDTILFASQDEQTVSSSVGYSKEEISLVPEKANMGLGCGNPFHIVPVKEGDTLIDLGSGAGFDCFLASHKVGRRGKVIGVDMTPEMLSLSRQIAKRKPLPKRGNRPAGRHFFVRSRPAEGERGAIAF